MEDKLTYEKLLQLIKKIKNQSNNEFLFTFPEWFVEENKEHFDFKNNEVYFHGTKVFVYPNEFKG